MGSADLWRDLHEILEENLSRIVIAYNRFGFGKSDARNDKPSLNFIEEEATLHFPAIKSALFISKYILFGHSVGGAMSINIGSYDLDCIGAFTVASQAFVEELTIRGIEKAKKEFQEPGQIERLMKWHGKKARWILQAWADVWLSPEFFSWSLAPCIGKLVCPVLAIHGDKDECG